MGKHVENLPVEEPSFKRWLAHEFYRGTGNTPKRDALNQAIDEAAARAHFDGKEHTAWVRVARGPNGFIYLDLGDSDWRAVEIRPDGWDIVTEPPPVKFRRSVNALALPVPTHGGSIGELRVLLKLKDDNEIAFKFIVAFLIGCFLPEGPFPILWVIGPEGSIKTSVLRFIMGFIDPQVSATPGPPKKEDDLVVTANARWLVIFDNLSRISIEMANAHCRLATGGGVSKRKLFMNEGVHAINVKRPQLMSGRSIGTEQSDFLDRMMIVQLDRISRADRLDEASINAMLAAARPGILGALLDAASAALANHADARARLKGRFPRMADFGIFSAKQQLSRPFYRR